MTDRVSDGIFHARSDASLSVEQVQTLLQEAVDRAIPEGDQKQEITNRVVSRISAIFSGVQEIASINSWSHLLSARFDIGRDKQEHPESSGYIDGVCHVLRGRITLALHPKKIDELAEMLRSHNLHQWNVNTFRRLGSAPLKNWFSKNVRAENGTIDWALIAELVNRIYPCTFVYQEHRENFTRDSALSRARQLIDDVLAVKNQWHPAIDIEAPDKQLYFYLTSLAEFRRKAKRPDIANRRDDRPNWSKIAEAMGARYQETMVISRKGHENAYRDFEDAIDELGDLLDDNNPDTWTITFIERRNSALYAWFKNHCRDEQQNVDIRRIAQALPIKWQERLRQNS